MRDVIAITNLNKEFKAKQKEAGLLGSFKGVFAPKYKLIKAVDDISFNVKKGEIVGFIGPNGAGKSTTIKMLTGILFPTSGDIEVLGFNPQEKRKDLAFHIGTVFGQKPQLWYHLPAIDTFNLFAKIYELDSKTYKRRLKRLIKLFEVEDLIKQPVRKLSLGQRMRCEIIASLLHKPKVLFLDEPTIGLDIVVKKKIRELIKDLNKKEKITIILTSHDMEDVEQICNRLVIINKGQIVYDGSTRKIREKYLRYKIVNVVLEDKKKSLNIRLKGVSSVKKSDYQHELEIDTSRRSIQTILHKIISMYNVADITVVDPPIEEIIGRIFKKGV